MKKLSFLFFIFITNLSVAQNVNARFSDELNPFDISFDSIDSVTYNLNLIFDDLTEGFDKIIIKAYDSMNREVFTFEEPLKNDVYQIRKALIDHFITNNDTCFHLMFLPQYKVKRFKATIINTSDDKKSDLPKEMQDTDLDRFYLNLVKSISNELKQSFIFKEIARAYSNELYEKVIFLNEIKSYEQNINGYNSLINKWSEIEKLVLEITDYSKDSLEYGFKILNMELQELKRIIPFDNIKVNGLLDDYFVKITESIRHQRKYNIPSLNIIYRNILRFDSNESKIIDEAARCEKGYQDFANTQKAELTNCHIDYNNREIDYDDMVEELSLLLQSYFDENKVSKIQLQNLINEFRGTKEYINPNQSHKEKLLFIEDNVNNIIKKYGMLDTDFRPGPLRSKTKKFLQVKESDRPFWHIYYSKKDFNNLFDGLYHFASSGGTNSFSERQKLTENYHKTKELINSQYNYLLYEHTFKQEFRDEILDSVEDIIDIHYNDYIALLPKPLKGEEYQIVLDEVKNIWRKFTPKYVGMRLTPKQLTDSTEVALMDIFFENMNGADSLINIEDVTVSKDSLFVFENVLSAINRMDRAEKKQIYDNLTGVFCFETKSTSFGNNLSNVPMRQNVIINNYINEDSLADFLAPKINYLNMDTYIGLGVSKLNNKFDGISGAFKIQPITLDLETKANYERQFQPFLGVGLEIYQTSDIILDFNYGWRYFWNIYNSSFSFGPSLSAGYFDIDDTNVKNNKSEIKDSSSYIAKTYYQGDFGVKLDYTHRFYKNNQYGFGLSLSHSVPSFDRTYNISCTNTDKTSITKSLNYWKIDLNVYYVYSGLKGEIGYRSFIINELDNKKDVVADLDKIDTGLIYFKLLFRLNND